MNSENSIESNTITTTTTAMTTTLKIVNVIAFPIKMNEKETCFFLWLRVNRHSAIYAIYLFDWNTSECTLYVYSKNKCHQYTLLALSLLIHQAISLKWNCRMMMIMILQRVYGRCMWQRCDKLVTISQHKKSCARFGF